LTEPLQSCQVSFLKKKEKEKTTAKDGDGKKKKKKLLDTWPVKKEKRIHGVYVALTFGACRDDNCIHFIKVYLFIYIWIDEYGRSIEGFF
jgi:hypothetical protein